MMDDRLYELVMERLGRIESKLDAHIEAASPVHAEIAVLKAELRLIKFLAGGLGIAFLTLIAEAAWRLLTAGG